MVPWLQAVIRPNGDVYPCCRLGDDGNEVCRDARYRLGNLREARLRTIIQGARAQSVRLAVMHDHPEACSSCELGRICSFESLTGEDREEAVKEPGRTLDHSEYLRV